MEQTMADTLNDKALHQLMQQRLDDDSLRILCEYIKVDVPSLTDLDSSHLPGDSLSVKAMSLIRYCHQRRIVRSLIENLHLVRPDMLGNTYNAWLSWAIAQENPQSSVPVPSTNRPLAAAPPQPLANTQPATVTPSTNRPRPMPPPQPVENSPSSAPMPSTNRPRPLPPSQPNRNISGPVQREIPPVPKDSSSDDDDNPLSQIPDLRRRTTNHSMFDDEDESEIRPAPKGSTSDANDNSLSQTSNPRERAKYSMFDDEEEPPPRLRVRNEHNLIDELYAELNKAVSAGENWDLAITLGLKIISMNPYHRLTRDKLKKAYVSRGHINYSIKGYEQAIADYNRAAEIDPNDEYIYYYRGNTYYDLKRYDMAHIDYSLAIDIDPEFAEAYNRRGDVYHVLKQYKQAINEYNQAILFDPSNANVYNSRAVAYDNLKQYEQAIADYTQAIRIDPNFALFYYHRGIAFSNRREKARAIADYVRVLELSDDPKLRWRAEQGLKNLGVR